MKKIVSLLLALLMVFGAVSALADNTWENDWYKVTESYDKETKTTTQKYYWKDTGEYAFSRSTAPGKNNNEVIVKYDYSWDSVNRVSTVNTKTWEQNTYLVNDNGKVTGVGYDDGHDHYIELDTNGNMMKVFLDKVYYDGGWFDYEGNPAKEADYSKLLEKARKLLKGKVPSTDPVWYTNNTACVMGISLRDEYPGLTSKWYNALPVDISKDGTQTFKMVASNIYFMGSVTVTVSGDSIVTTYSYPDGRSYEIYPVDECLAWFTGVEEITHDFLENPTSDLKFGQAISREKDLNGQETALLFICNHVSYKVPFNSNGAMPTRCWRNSSKYSAYFANAHLLLAKAETEYAAKKETAVVPTIPLASADADATAEETATVALETATAAAETAAAATETANEVVVRTVNAAASEAAAAAIEAANAAMEAANAAMETANAALEAAQAAAAEAAGN